MKPEEKSIDSWSVMYGWTPSRKIKSPALELIKISWLRKNKLNVWWIPTAMSDDDMRIMPWNVTLENMQSYCEREVN